MVAVIIAVCYAAIGFAYMLLCFRSIESNARILQEHGRVPLIYGAFLRAYLLWPFYLFHKRAPQFAQDPDSKVRPLFLWRRPDYDKIEKLEREIYGKRETQP